MRKPLICFLLLPVLIIFSGCGNDRSPTEPTEPNRVYVERITVNEMPLWGDPFSGPDVIIEISTFTTPLFTAPENFGNVTLSDLPISLSLPYAFRIPDWSENYYVRLWDDDGDPDSRFQIGSAIFRINSVLDEQLGYPTAIDIHNYPGTVLIELRLRWE